MDKLAYHYNKKKLPAKTEGKFLYYYPCNENDKYDVRMGGRGFIVIEVAEQEWETLFEMDRLEYNRDHRHVRHDTPFPDADEDHLPPKEQERHIDREPPFEIFAHEEIDRRRIVLTLTPREREIYHLCIEGDATQTSAAHRLGVTQGYVSTTVKRIKRKLAACQSESDDLRDLTVTTIWNDFVKTWTMPNFLDVELEFVLRAMLGDLLPLLHQFYSLGELGRYILRYYLFDEDKLDSDVAAYLVSAPQEEQKHFQECYKEQPLIVQGVYVRLQSEMLRRRKVGLRSSDKAFTGIYATVEKIAKRLKVSVEDFLTQRFYPYIAKWRNERLEKFYKLYTLKKIS